MLRFFIKKEILMALEILFYPHPILRIPAKPVLTFDEEIQSLANQMIESMYAHRCVGLAAPQVGASLQLFVMDTTHEQNQPTCFINPKILSEEGSIEQEEACASIPGVYSKVIRAKTITVCYQDEKGNEHTTTEEGLRGQCIQHEYEHLLGILWIDKLSRLKRERMLKKFERNQRWAS